MGYRVTRMKQLEEENSRLREESTFWEIEAKRQTAENGELKIKIAKAKDKLETLKERSEDSNG